MSEPAEFQGFPLFQPTKCQAKGCQNDVMNPGDLVCEMCCQELEGWLELLSIGKVTPPENEPQ